MSWTDDATRAFLLFYKESQISYDDKTFKTKTELWSDISKKMVDAGYDVLPQQAENKFKSLERAYRNNEKNKKNKYVRSRDVVLFDEELHEMFSDKLNKCKFANSDKPCPIDHTEEQERRPSTDSNDSKQRASKQREGRLAMNVEQMKASIDALTNKIEEDMNVKKELLREIRQFQEHSHELIRIANEERKRKNDILEAFLGKRSKQ